jgi:hypothetical protein
MPKLIIINNIIIIELVHGRRHEGHRAMRGAQLPGLPRLPFKKKGE